MNEGVTFFGLSLVETARLDCIERLLKQILEKLSKMDDLTTEDQSVKKMTDDIHHAKDRLPHGT